MSKKVCPYPGLRPFTVQESYFFKGRDAHVRQIISKLEVNKILILTGASGDGKSSLVYAGIIPNAKAGFFRAKYNKWLFADFRPERSPLQNLAKSISTALSLDYDHVETELGYGFSSLVDLYKSSPHYIDKESNEWKEKNPAEQRRQLLKAANLFILADQFEEFFTNSENFTNGTASSDAYTTVNLLLETAKIAYNEHLPIYVICTLRSDFISQCIAFRGLPEAIGFSQFFVPRLNRNELQQVIEEPAILSAGKVSKRLKELLINELHKGFDQLPILQHTLKQLWEYAEGGNQELDLMHLAKLGGLNKKYLDENDQIIFQKWFDSINNVQKKHIGIPSSSNVLNAHANLLYETAFEHSKKYSWFDGTITETQAQHIIKISFQCLTKIDQGRAVRNRASLQEIVNIINQEHITSKTVCAVLNIFRLQGNTFLRPFIELDNIETEYLSYETVLDITHEALIRNWEYLKQWNTEEYENLNEFNEFRVQLQRWIDNKYSEHFLLPSGTLMHFEEWHQQCQPNKYWLAKYDSSAMTYEEKVRNAEILAENSWNFLQMSRQHITNIEKAKARRIRMAIMIAAIVILILSGFSYWANSEKINANKQRKLAETQTKEANIQRGKAVVANQIAEQERALAKANEKAALASKALSDSNRALAERNAILADKNAIMAKNEAQKALAEKKTANEQRAIAERQSVIADIQRKSAISANDSAKGLTYLAIAQSLAYKAIQKNEDKQVSLLLAYQSYVFNKKYGGYPRENFIYNALRSSINQTKGLNNKIDVENASSFLIDKTNALVLSKNGRILTYTIDNHKLINTNESFKTDIPINASFFISPTCVVASLENKEVRFMNLSTGKYTVLSGHTDYLRAVSLSSDKQYLVTAGRDKTVFIWKILSNGIEKIDSYTFSARVNSAIFTTNNSIFVGTSTGETFKLNLFDKKTESFFLQPNASVQTMCISTKRNIVAVGYSTGIVQLFDLTTLKKIRPIMACNSGTKAMTFDAQSKILMVSGDDKTVRMIDLDHSDKNHITITNTNQKIVSLFYSNEKIFGLSNLNTVFFWENNTDTYAEAAKKLISRNLTPEEWNTFVGEKFPYELTIK